MFCFETRQVALLIAIAVVTLQLSHVPASSRYVDEVSVYIGGHFEAEIFDSHLPLKTVAMYTGEVNASSVNLDPSQRLLSPGKWTQFMQGDSFRSSGYVVSALFFDTACPCDPTTRRKQILVGGNFSYVGQAPAGNVAKIFYENNTVHALSVGVNGPVSDMIKIGENISLISGNFNRIQTSPPVGITGFMAKYDIWQDLWTSVNSPPLASPPLYLRYCAMSKKLWVVGYFNKQQVFCRQPFCTSMYVVTGTIKESSATVFFDGSANGTYSVFKAQNFVCGETWGIREDMESLGYDFPCKLAMVSTATSFEAYNGSLYMLTLVDEVINPGNYSWSEACLDSDGDTTMRNADCMAGKASIWRYKEFNTTFNGWELVSFGLPECRCDLLPEKCSRYVNQIAFAGKIPGGRKSWRWRVHGYENRWLDSGR